MITRSSHAETIVKAISSGSSWWEVCNSKQNITCSHKFLSTTSPSLSQLSDNSSRKWINQLSMVLFFDLNIEDFEYFFFINTLFMSTFPNSQNLKIQFKNHINKIVCIYKKSEIKSIFPDKSSHRQTTAISTTLWTKIRTPLIVILHWRFIIDRYIGTHWSIAWILI